MPSKSQLLCYQSMTIISIILIAVTVNINASLSPIIILVDICHLAIVPPLFTTASTPIYSSPLQGPQIPPTMT